MGSLLVSITGSEKKKQKATRLEVDKALVKNDILSIEWTTQFKRNKNKSLLFKLVSTFLIQVQDPLT